MNIDRGGFAIKPAPPSGDGGPSVQKPDDAPAFRLETDRAPALDGRRADAAARRETSGSAPRDDDAPTADATASARVRADRPAGARGEARSHRTDLEPAASTRDPSVADDANPTHATARAANDRPDPTTDEPALPGLMLALLSGEPAPAVPADAPPGIAAGIAMTGNASAGAPWTRGPAASIDSGAATAAPTAVGLDPIGQGVSAIGAAAIAVDNVAMSASGATDARGGVAQPAAAPPATDTAPNVQALLAAATPAAGPGAPTVPAGTAAMPAAASMPAAATADRTLPPEAAAFAAFVRERPERGERTTPGGDGPAPLTTALGAPREAGLVATPSRLLAVAPASTPVALDADFDDGLAGRVTWMADQRIDRAEIRVNPEGLGTIDIRLQMDGSRVHAHFHAANADVRHALEGGLDRLRDLLGRQGMELGQAQVGSGGARDDGRAGRTPAGFGGAPSTDTPGEPAVTTVRVLRGRGLLDEYA